MPISQINKNEIIRHSFSHILAQAVLRLYPGVKLGIGPATKNGFYYDFSSDKSFDHEDLTNIEAEMIEIIHSQLTFQQVIIPKDQAFNTLFQLGQIYKTELLQLVPDETVSMYKTGEEFIDLCRGPHVKHTGQLKYFRLIKISRHHWLNDAKRPIFQRIEGIAFATKSDYDEYFQKIQELKNRNHVILGKKLKLFEINSTEKNILWLTKGLTLKNAILNIFSSNFQNESFESIAISNFNKLTTPKINSTEEITFSSHLQFFKSQRRSIRTLPVKVVELSYLRNLNKKSRNDNLTNINQVISPISSIYIDSKNLKTELTKIINLLTLCFNNISFSNIKLRIAVPEALSTHQNSALQILTESLQELSMKSRISQQKTTSNQPEIILYFKDEFEREWILSTIYLQLNENTAKYQASEKETAKSDMICIKIFESLEEIIAIILESTGGNIPIWIAPIQIILISVSERYNESVKKLKELFSSYDIRSSIDIRNNTVEFKIRKAQLQQIPYMLIIGEKETRTNSVSVRKNTGSDLGLVKIDDFIKEIKIEIISRNTDLKK
ncbi:MAG: His/Gly/Thr/Pro-type tRNA ligase C-terminal domain-containing protein [bacterium]